MRQVVIRQAAKFEDRVNMRQASLWAIPHGNGDGSIEVDNRGRLHARQLVVKRDNLAPVSRSDRFRLRMNGRDGSLQGVRAEAAGAAGPSPP